MLIKFFAFCSLVLIFSLLIMVSCNSSNIGVAESDRGLDNKVIEYQLVSSASWKIDGKAGEQLIEAKLEKANTRLKNISTNQAPARLTVRNVTTGITIYQKNENSFPESVHKADFYLNSNSVLLVTWGAASASRLEVYTVNQSEIRQVLTTSFKDAYTVQMSPRGGEKTEIFAIDNSLEDDNNLLIKRHVWNGNEFILEGQIRYDKFFEMTKLQFAQP